MGALGGGGIEGAIKAAAFTTASFGVWGGVGGMLDTVQKAAHMSVVAFAALKGAVHGVVGGALSMVQGGSFMDGFAANAIGAVAGAASESVFGPAGKGGAQGFFARTATAAIAGGTASELTGGKFANGALTAGFAQMWNAERSARPTYRSNRSKDLASRMLRYLEERGREIGDDLSGLGAVADNLEQLYNLKSLNIRGSDKYFHCVANCYSAQRGDVGSSISDAIGQSKEWFDQTFRRFSPQDSQLDLAANQFGRDQGTRFPGAACSVLCTQYRVRGIPNGY